MKRFQYADERQAKLYKKFPSTHFLSNPNNLDHVFLWCTFFRRNMHRFAEDYLGIKLYLYQAIILYIMGNCRMLAIIAVRAAAKSYIVAVYSCCYCCLYPNGQAVLSSGTKKQAGLIVTKKIQSELMPRSPALRREIKEVKTNPEIIISFHSNATISVVTATETGRGNRSTVSIRDEFRMIKKSVEDSVISPCQIVRQPAYMLLEPYCNKEYYEKWGLQELPIDIYISSSWLDNGHWMWETVDTACKEMLSGKDNVFLLAFDESIPLKHNIKTEKQLQLEHKKVDPLTWRIEFLNERVKENTSALFTYKMLMDNQNLKKPFYPLAKGQNKRKSYNKLEKQKGEIRIISCDMAFIANKDNDNTVYSCIRALPESTSYETQGKTVEVQNGYRRIVCYMEHRQGGEIEKQAIRIRQLYEDFEADYIVLDGQNSGLAVYEYLAKVMYDEERDVEYSPLCCMNNDEFKNRVNSENAKPVIFIIRASEKLNSDIAVQFKEVIESHKIDLLVNLNVAKEETFGKIIKDYSYDLDYEEQLYFENPFLETQLFINETAELVYTKKANIVVVREQGKNTKDRYTSVSYGSYFIGTLENQLYSDNLEDELFNYVSCASVIDF